MFLLNLLVAVGIIYSSSFKAIGIFCVLTKVQIIYMVYFFETTNPL